MKIHIISIAGTLTAPLAIALLKEGHQVSGSDQADIFPPISTLITDSKIYFNPPLNSISPDLVIVGPSFSKFKRTREEYFYFKKHNFKIISATKYIASNIIKENSILVAGSYGKSTITALVTAILTESKLNPSYMYGAISLDGQPSLAISDSKWSIVEADESINGLDKKAKFLYYQVKYLILTSANWEHKDSYKTASENLLAYKDLIKRLPSDGLLIYNDCNASAKSLIKYAVCPCFGYRYSQKTKYLFGQANRNNLAAAITLCHKLGINKSMIEKALAKFKGLKRRLELVFSQNDIFVYDDFGQSAPRIGQSLKAIKSQYPKHKIIAIFEPHASFLQYQPSLTGLKNAFLPADIVILSKIHFSKSISKSNRVSLFDYQQEIGAKLIYRPICTDLYQSVLKDISKFTVIIRFSSGGWETNQAFNKFINQLKYV